MLLWLFYLVVPGFSRRMDLIIENGLTYGLAALIIIAVFYIYIRKLRRETLVADEKIALAIEEGFHEPVTLHPVIDVNSCIKSGACVKACPEKDVIGIRNGRATIINGSHCIGHGACVRACPVQAITLCIGTEKRGVDIPEIDETFETNVPGIYIAGELGGMGLIKNAVEQGKQAVEYISEKLSKERSYQYDLVVVGAGPAGISATLMARKLNINSITLEQDSLGGTVSSFPRSKIVMTAPMDLPLHGKVRFFETNKMELLNLWNKVLANNKLTIKEQVKVESVSHVKEGFKISTTSGETFFAQKVLLAIGRRGSPRKLNVPGEQLEKVAYQVIEPELVSNKDILIVGGGDSAVEAALLLSGPNNVVLSYRGENFTRIKPKNREKINRAIDDQKIDVLFQSTVVSISEDSVLLAISDREGQLKIKNDLVYIFAGGELPLQLLQNAGIQVSKKYGEAILKNEG